MADLTELWPPANLADSGTGKVPTIQLGSSTKTALSNQPNAPIMRCIGSQVTREGRMMKVQKLSTVAIVSLVAAALSGCVSMGSTRALVTPVGAIGYHTFKPDNAPSAPRDINLPRQERVAASSNDSTPKHQ